MFFHMKLRLLLRLEPRHFGRDMQARITQRLYQEVEGKCVGRYGYIVAVTSIEKIGLGKIQDGSGCCVFPVEYKAIVFRPIHNEIMLSVVSQVADHGVWADAGPLQLFVSRMQMPTDLRYDKNCSPPAWVADEMPIKLCDNSEMRVKITGSNMRASDISCVGSINEDFLGPLDEERPATPPVDEADSSITTSGAQDAAVDPLQSSRAAAPPQSSSMDMDVTDLTSTSTSSINGGSGY
ncbi:DNA-directed RNA polymerase II subunit RPB7 [Pelomyxa schiedti]|nr:DNA-directed RNA polymerase II subunit RPB7 [Pelomyxa schiedti]